MIQRTVIKRSSKKIPSHYGMQDFFKYYKENSKEPVSRTTYNKIISLFNEEIIYKILNEYKVYTLPIIRLKIGIRKTKPKIRLLNGVVVNGNPIDWVTTNKLWEDSEEAKKNKVIVRFTNKLTFGYVFRVYALKFAVKFKNKAIFRFKTSRKFQRELSKRIKDNKKEKFDSYLLY